MFELTWPCSWDTEQAEGGAGRASCKSWEQDSLNGSLSKLQNRQRYQNCVMGEQRRRAPLVNPAPPTAHSAQLLRALGRRLDCTDDSPAEPAALQLHKPAAGRRNNTCQSSVPGHRQAPHEHVRCWARCASACSAAGRWCQRACTTPSSGLRWLPLGCGGSLKGSSTARAPGDGGPRGRGHAVLEHPRVRELHPPAVAALHHHRRRACHCLGRQRQRLHQAEGASCSTWACRPRCFLPHSGKSRLHWATGGSCSMLNSEARHALRLGPNTVPCRG